jgi:hypothetical protein
MACFLALLAAFLADFLEAVEVLAVAAEAAEVEEDAPSEPFACLLQAMCVSDCGPMTLGRRSRARLNKEQLIRIPQLHRQMQADA